MVNLLSAELDFTFYALSDPTRRKILSMMGEKVRTITELAEPFHMSLAAISKHIKILEKAKLLHRTRQGRIHECTLNVAALKNAEACIQFYTQFWNVQLDAFVQELENTSPKGILLKTKKKESHGKTR